MTMENDYSIDPAGADDLAGRVRRAHEQELSGGGEVDPSEVDGPPLSDGLQEAERRVVSETDDELEQRLIATACEVIAGQHDSAEGVREAVVDTVVDANYDGLVAGGDRDAIVDAVQETLTRDVTFRKEVETMLIHAARRLGEAQRDQWNGRPESGDPTR